MVRFDGEKAKVICVEDVMHIYYGNSLALDGCGYVKAQGNAFAERIVYWRLPEKDGSTVVIDDHDSSERLANHLSGHH